MRDHVDHSVIDLDFLDFLALARELSHSRGHGLLDLALLEFEESLLFRLAEVSVEDADLEL